MAYATVQDIQSEFKSVAFSATTSVTSAEINSFIGQADQEINAHISVKYALPIIDVDGLKFLKAIAISIVADRVAGILKVKTANQKVDQNSKTGHSSVWGRKMLKQLQKGELFLVDATGASLPKATTHDGFESYNVENGIEHTFKKGEDQW